MCGLFSGLVVLWMEINESYLCSAALKFDRAYEMYLLKLYQNDTCKDILQLEIKKVEIISPIGSSEQSWLYTDLSESTFSVWNWDPGRSPKQICSAKMAMPVLKAQGFHT